MVAEHGNMHIVKMLLETRPLPPPRCGPGHTLDSFYRPPEWGSSRRNTTRHYCGHWTAGRDRQTNRMFCHDDGSLALFVAQNDTGNLRCYNESQRDPKGYMRVKRVCSRGENWISGDGLVLCPANQERHTLRCHDWFTGSHLP